MLSISRVTTYWFDEGCLEEALEKLYTTVRVELKAIAGLESFQEFRIADGQGMSSLKLGQWGIS